VRRADNLTTFMCRLSWNLGASTPWDPLGLSRHVMGLLYHFTHKECKVKVKVKCSRYRPGVAQRVGRGIALLFHDLGTRSGWVVSSTPWAHFTHRERPGTHFTWGWVGPRAGLDGRKNLVPTGIRSRTVRPVAQSLYRLSYRARHKESKPVNCSVT